MTYQEYAHELYAYFEFDDLALECAIDGYSVDVFLNRMLLCAEQEGQVLTHLEEWDYKAFFKFVYDSVMEDYEAH